MLNTSQSQIVEAQRCPRRRWWSHFALPQPCGCLDGTDGIERSRADPCCARCHGAGIESGIVPTRKSVPLLAGSAVHYGLASLLLRRGNVEGAVAKAQELYSHEVSETTPLELRNSEEQAYVIAEQMALAEALVRLAALRIVPAILSHYEVIWAECALDYPLSLGGHDDVVLHGRPDALLQERASDNIYVLNWKTKGASRLDDRALEDAQHDDQGLADTWLTERWLLDKFEAWAGDVSGVIMVWLLKGERREQPKGSGQWQQASPLVRAWRRFNPDGYPEFAWAYRWDDAGSVRTLGRGWERIDVWTQPGGVSAWLDLLATGTVQPEAGDCLAEQYVMPAPYYRQPTDVKDWIGQAYHGERQAAGYRNQCWDVPDSEALLNANFPQHRHACSYPLRCPYYQLCWGPPHVREAPMENGFVRRTPFVPLDLTIENGIGQVAERLEKLK